MTSQLQRAERFHALHQGEHAFVIPNPWDTGSARLLEGLGFAALATTSAGCANALGRLDGEVSRDEALAHCRMLCAATNLPVTADLENGFGREPEAVAKTIRLAAQAGLVGGSIEDCAGEPAHRIYDFELAVERVVAAVEAARSLAFPFCLTARAENLWRGEPNLDDTIRRLCAFEAAGADVLYAPGLKTLTEVREVTAALGKPVNVLGPMVAGASVEELSAAGARRISVGGALARAATTALVDAGRALLDHGSFSWSANLLDGTQLKRLLGR